MDVSTFSEIAHDDHDADSVNHTCSSPFQKPFSSCDVSAASAGAASVPDILQSKDSVVAQQRLRKLAEADTQGIREQDERTNFSDDGYSWKKYGHKKILGLKCTRSYYKCVHARCQAKKRVERSDEDPEGFKVTYEGIHTCPYTGTTQNPTAAPAATSPEKQEKHQQKRTKINSHISNIIPQNQSLEIFSKLKAGMKDGTENLDNNEMPIPPFVFPLASLGTRNCSSSPLFKWTNKVKVNLDTGLEEPHHNDGYNWRKYGQKVILGKKYPRSYYRCTHSKTQNCWATKQVQRSNEDPTVFEITYRGKHTCCYAETAQNRTPTSPQSQEQDISFLSNKMHEFELDSNLQSC